MRYFTGDLSKLHETNNPEVSVLLGDQCNCLTQRHVDEQNIIKSLNSMLNVAAA